MQEEVKASPKVPSVVGMTYKNALGAIQGVKLNMKLDATTMEEITDDYVAVSQTPEANSEVAEGTDVYVKFAARHGD